MPKNINQVIQESFDNVDLNEIIRKKVYEQAELTIKKSVEELFSYHGPIKEKIQAEMKKASNIDLSSLTILGLSNVMSEAIVDATNNLIRGETQEMVQKHLYGALGTFAKFNNVNSMIEEIVEEYDEENFEWGDDHISGSISISIQQEEGYYSISSPKKYWSIFLEADEGCNDEELKLYISEYSNKIYHLSSDGNIDILRPLGDRLNQILNLRLDIYIEESTYCFSNMDI